MNELESKNAMIRIIKSRNEELEKEIQKAYAQRAKLLIEVRARENKIRQYEKKFGRIDNE